VIKANQHSYSVHLAWILGGIYLAGVRRGCITSFYFINQIQKVSEKRMYHLISQTKQSICLFIGFR